MTLEKATQEEAALPIGGRRQARRAYGFDEVAIVPGAVTLDPEDVDLSCNLAGLELRLPLLSSTLDAVADPEFAGALSALGGIAVLNLEGLQCRYENPSEAIERIVSAPREQVVEVIQRVYAKPLEERLVPRRIEELREHKARVAVAATPGAASRFAGLIGKGQLDLFVVGATITTARHLSSRHESPSFPRLRDQLEAPVFVGNCVSYRAALELMQAGAEAVLVGVGPGAICTTRRVLGIGVPQVTAIAEAAAARDDHETETGKRVAVIADGGMRTGGEIAKAFAAGADGVMMGSPLAMAKEAPGRGFSWGMATSDPGLPRGTRIQVGTAGTLKEILLGPTHREDGTMNLFGGLRLAMASCGARGLREMQRAELVIAPALPSEGKAEQRAQAVGMGK
jgi:IMP dehydrogenase